MSLKKLLTSITKTVQSVASEPIRVGQYNLEKRKMIGEGGYSTVFLAVDPTSQKEYALKRMVASSQENIRDIENEINFMKNLRHENIVQLIHTETNQLADRKREYLLLQEFCPSTLMSEMNSVATTTRLTEIQIDMVFEQILNGIIYMHMQSPPIFHRDIKIENIFHSADGKYKIGDFGSATTALIDPSSLSSAAIVALEEDITKKTTPCYRSPEMVDLYRKQTIGTKADIWALGCILYTMCFYENPFENGGDLAILNVSYNYPTPEQFESEEYQRLQGKGAPRPYFTKELLGLIDFMLEPSPDKRPDALQVMVKYCEMMGKEYPSNLPYPNPPSAPSIQPRSLKIFDAKAKPKAKQRARPKPLKELTIADLERIAKKHSRDEDEDDFDESKPLRFSDQPSKVSTDTWQAPQKQPSAYVQQKPPQTRVQQQPPTHTMSQEDFFSGTTQMPVSSFDSSFSQQQTSLVTSGSFFDGFDNDTTNQNEISGFTPMDGYQSVGGAGGQSQTQQQPETFEGFQRIDQQTVDGFDEPESFFSADAMGLLMGSGGQSDFSNVTPQQTSQPQPQPVQTTPAQPIQPPPQQPQQKQTSTDFSSFFSTTESQPQNQSENVFDSFFSQPSSNTTQQAQTQPKSQSSDFDSFFSSQPAQQSSPTPSNVVTFDQPPPARPQPVSSPSRQFAPPPPQQQAQQQHNIVQSTPQPFQQSPPPQQHQQFQSHPPAAAQAPQTDSSPFPPFVAFTQPPQDTSSADAISMMYSSNKPSSNATSLTSSLSPAEMNAMFGSGQQSQPQSQLGQVQHQQQPSDVDVLSSFFVSQPQQGMMSSNNGMQFSQPGMAAQGQQQAPGPNNELFQFFQ